MDKKPHVDLSPTAKRYLLILSGTIFAVAGLMLWFGSLGLTVDDFLQGRKIIETEKQKESIEKRKEQNDGLLSDKSYAYVMSQGYVEDFVGNLPKMDFPIADFEFRNFKDERWAIFGYFDYANELGGITRVEYTAQVEYVGDGDSSTMLDRESWELKTMIIPLFDVYK